MHLWVLIAGLIMLAAALPVAGRRVLFLGRLITSGQPAPDRVRNVTQHFGDALRNQLVEVLGQKKLLKWSVPGAAHFFVFWAFLILGSVYLEAFGVLFSRNPAWHIPIVGRWDLLGFAQDFIAVMCLVGLATFAGIRLKNAPERLGRRSRFSGSHLGGAWVILGMIFNVIWTMLLFRGAGAASGNLPYGNGAFASHAVGRLFGSLSEGALEDLEGVGLLLHIGVMLAFLVIVLNSKHLHIFVAPLNVAFGRHPVALGAVKPLTVAGQPVTLDDIEDMDESTALGIGSIEDFSWKGMLDFATCTECGRCQSQCPAWNTEKPLSPKLLIMNLRDHAFEKAPYLLADPSDREALPAGVRAEADRALVGATEGDPAHPSGGAVIDDDVLWSCVTCGACVEQCPVDIEHVDHIVDMRRYQVLVESNFPAELNQLFKGMENKGNPWNMSPTARMDWAKGLDFDVKVVGAPADEGGVESLDDVEWLFWVGCAGAYEDRAKKTTRAVAELLNIAGVDFAVLGNGETCSGDQARRAGNEFVFQGLAQQNAETFKEFRVTKVVSTCAHCFNTLKNEYQQFGVELEVVHHTQLLNRLVREGRLTPVQEGAGAHKRSITYHDPCYIGRHNGVYSPPRELLQVLPGAEYVEMERNSERSFCCGAGGARMWMEENLGTRINVNRTNEAIGTGADQIAVGCPFCRVMLSDGLTAAIDQGEAREEVEVLDVAQMLLASVKGEQATKLAPGASAKASQNGGQTGDQNSDQNGDRTAGQNGHDVATKAEPEAGDETITEDTVTETADAGPAAKASGGSSLFDDPSDPDDAEPATTGADRTPQEEAGAARPTSSGGSLFDVDEADEDRAKPAPVAEPASEPELDASSKTGGSLFDLGDDQPAAEPAAKADPEPEARSEAGTPAEAKTPAEEPAAAGSAPQTDLGGGGSLFDIQEEEPDPKAESEREPQVEVEPEPEVQPEPESAADAAPEVDLGGGGSLFDIQEDQPEASPEPEPEPEPEIESEVAPEVEAGPEPTESEPAAEAPEPVVASSSPGSLFDIASPDAGAGPATPAEPAAQQPAPDRPVVAAPSGGSLFDVATPDAQPEAESPADEPAEAAEDRAEDQAEDETTDQVVDSTEEPAPEPVEEKPGPAASGESHTPKTDVDISDAGSLFDL